MTESWHGTHGGYTNKKCRCGDCRAAALEYQRRLDKSKRESPLSGVEHGDESGYAAGCRCKECFASHRRQYMQARRKDARGKFAVSPEAITHGTDEGYQAGCRCFECKRFRQARNLRYNYAMPIEQFEAMVEHQGGLCAICRQAPGGSKRDQLNVDHCHRTGEVRGLLCSSCNTGLGRLGDSIEGLERAIAYLKSAKKVDILGI